MAQTIIPKSDQLNADDLIAGEKTITITGVDIRPGTEQPISIHYEGDNGKPYKACKSMCRLMVTAWGADSKKYTGRSMTLYRDKTVKWGGMEVGGIRISHMTHIDSPLTLALTMTKQSRKPYTVKPLDASAAPSTAPPQEKGISGADTGPHSEPAAGAAARITDDEAMKLDARCQENLISVSKVKKLFSVEFLVSLTPAQLVEAHAMIDSTLAKRKDAA